MLHALIPRLEFEDLPFRFSSLCKYMNRNEFRKKEDRRIGDIRNQDQLLHFSFSLMHSRVIQLKLYLKFAFGSY